MHVAHYFVVKRNHLKVEHRGSFDKLLMHIFIRRCSIHFTHRRSILSHLMQVSSIV